MVFSRRTFSPERRAKSLRGELDAIEKELDEILRPGGVAYNVKPEGKKLDRYNQLMARRTEIQHEQGKVSTAMRTEADD
ncbi:MAG TPA: hypothetical protein DDZ88_25445 [Verrucomicrobiales bacterium]|nr:hypothetical protein [Verrucomicrobiales bacterium]